MSKRDIDELRRDIDKIDSHIQDLLQKRVDIVDEIVKVKRKSGKQIIFPAREADLMRKLFKAHSGKFPRKSLFRIWREIIGATTILQTKDVHIAIPATDSAHSAHDALSFMELAKDYFSSSIPVKRASNAVSVLAMVREGDATFGVLPWPEDGDKRSWWRMFKDEIGDEELNIIARLPFNDADGDNMSMAAQRALVVSKLPFDKSEADRTFLVVELGEAVSRGGLVDKCKQEDLEPVSIYTSPDDGYSNTLHLIEVDEYIEQGDKRLAALEKSIGGGSMTRCYRIGGYAVPPKY